MTDGKYNKELDKYFEGRGRQQQQMLVGRDDGDGLEDI